MALFHTKPRAQLSDRLHPILVTQDALEWLTLRTSFLSDTVGPSQLPTCCLWVSVQFPHQGKGDHTLSTEQDRGVSLQCATERRRLTAFKRFFTALRHQAMLKVS